MKMFGESITSDYGYCMNRSNQPLNQPALYGACGSENRWMSFRNSLQRTSKNHHLSVIPAKAESSVFGVKGLKTLDPSLRWGDGVIRGSLQGRSASQRASSPVSWSSCLL